MVFFNVLSYILVLLGAVNWGMFGIFDFNLVSAIFMGPRSVGAIIVYCLIAAAAVWLIISPFLTNGMLKLQGNREARTVKESRRNGMNAGRDIKMSLPAFFMV